MNEEMPVDDRVGSLETEMRSVMARLRSVEVRLAINTVATPEPPRPQTAPQPPMIFNAPAVPPAPMHRAAPRQVEPPTPSGPSVDWEAIVGGRWALWVGAVLSFLAVGFFLAYTWHYLSPAGRLLVGVMAGLGFLGVGEGTRSRLGKDFAAGLAGAGLAILYLNAWAATSRYALVNFDVSLVLMVGVAAIGVALALRYDVAALSALAAVGGFLTPALLGTGGHGGSPLPFLAYLLVLDAGLLLVAVLRRWHFLSVMSLAGTASLLTGWMDFNQLSAHAILIFGFVSICFLMFLAAACFHSFVNNEPTQPADLLLLFSTTTVYTLAASSIWNTFLPNAPGAVPFGVAFVLGSVCLAANVLAPDNTVLGRATGGLGLTCLTIAIPQQLHEAWIAIAWSLESAVLYTLAVRGESEFLHYAATVLWSLAGLAVLERQLSAAPRPELFFLNALSLPVVAFLIANVWMTMARRRPANDTLGSIAPVTVVLGGAWLLAQQVMVAQQWHWLPDVRPGALYSIYAIVLAAFSLVAYTTGLRLADRAVRTAAVTVFSVAAMLPVLATAEFTPYGLPLWNPPFIAYLVTALAMAAMAWLAKNDHGQTPPNDREVNAFSLAAHVVLLWAVPVQIVGAVGAPISKDMVLAPAATFGIATFWAAYAALTLALGSAWRMPAWRSLAYVTGSASILMLLDAALGTVGIAWTPFLNPRFVAFVTVTAATAFAGYFEVDDASGSGSPMRRWAGVLAPGLALWGLTQETYHAFWFCRSTLGPGWERSAQMAVSLLWTLFASGALVAGIARRVRTMRLMAIGLFGLTTAKVMLIDLDGVNTPLRVLSFGLLGAALIGMSWLYTRYGPDIKSA